MSVFLSSPILLQASMLFLGVLLDLLFGDPGKLHLIILIGRLISSLERRLRAKYPAKPRKAGALLLLFSLLLTVLPCAALLIAAFCLSPLLALVLGGLICWQLLAGRSLFCQSMAVSACLKRGDLPSARAAVSMIVGRDTDALDAQGVSRAAVESVAENTSDGVIAPLFYIMLLGPVGGIAYKTINTLDSMVGYKNEKYIDLGRASAKADDLANLLPARLCALLMLFSAFLLRYDFRAALRIFLRDRNCHESPNSGRPESVTAGALHIRLGGTALYGGKVTERKFLGNGLRPVTAGDIYRANLLSIVSSALMLAIILIFTFLIYRSEAKL